LVSDDEGLIQSFFPLHSLPLPRTPLLSSLDVFPPLSSRRFCPFPSLILAPVVEFQVKRVVPHVSLLSLRFFFMLGLICTIFYIDPVPLRVGPCNFLRLLLAALELWSSFFLPFLPPSPHPSGAALFRFIASDCCYNG